MGQIKCLAIFPFKHEHSLSSALSIFSFLWAIISKSSKRKKTRKEKRIPNLLAYKTTFIQATDTAHFWQSFLLTKPYKTLDTPKVGGSSRNLCSPSIFHNCLFKYVGILIFNLYSLIVYFFTFFLLIIPLFSISSLIKWFEAKRYDSCPRWYAPNTE